MDDVEMNDNVINDVYNSHYFKLPKRLQEIIGLWPYNTEAGRLFGYFLLALLIIPLIPLMKTVFKTVAKNWLNLTDPEERKIILKYAALGKFKSVGYFVYMLCCAAVFCQAPLFPVFLDLINPLNESRDKILVVRAEYIIDPFENYYKIYAGFCFYSVLSLFIISGIDGIYTVVTHQNLAILAIVKHRLQVATEVSNVALNRDYEIIIKAILLHKECIEFTRLVEISYSTFFLVINALTVIFSSIAAVVTLRVIDDFKAEDDLFEFLRISMLEIGILIHLFYLTWSGQLILSHSEDLLISAYTNEWYNISKRGKELLKILMLRFTRPCAITAGGLYIMNFENFGAIIKTTVSYIAVATSFRG